LKCSVVAGGIWYSVSTAVIGCIDLISVVILSRLFSPGEFGAMAIVLLVSSFAAAYTDMGICSAVIQRRTLVREEFSSVYWLTVVTGLTIWLAMSAASPVIAFVFKEPLLKSLLSVAGVGFFIISFGLPFDWLLEKELYFPTLAKMDMTKALIGLIVSVACAYCGMGIWSLIVSYIAKCITSTVWLLVVGLPMWRPQFRLNLNELRSYARFGLFQMAERTMINLSYQVDQVLVGSLLGIQQLGYYNFALNQILLPLCRLTPILLRIALPVFCKLQDDRGALSRHYFKMSRLLNFMNAPLLFGMAVLAPVFVPKVFGAHWNPAIPCLQVLSFYMFCRNAGDLLSPLLLAKGHAGFSFSWSLSLFVVSIPCIVVGAMSKGLVGVSIALSLVMMTRLPASYAIFIRPLLGRSGVEAASCVLMPAIMAFAMGIELCALSAFLRPSLMSFTVEISLGAATYIALARFFDAVNFGNFWQILFEAFRMPSPEKADVKLLPWFH